MVRDSFNSRYELNTEIKQFIKDNKESLRTPTNSLKLIFVFNLESPGYKGVILCPRFSNIL